MRLLTLSCRSLCFLMLTCLGLPGLSRAFAQGIQPATAHTSSGAISHIVANSAPYHFEWNGTTGTFTREALASDSERKQALFYLHTDPGPKGYSKYLAWFLARDANGFSLIWAYLNASGREFYCWLYRFPDNQLISLRFVGSYIFTPLPEPVTAAPVANLDTSFRPRYSGPDFSFGDWNSRRGSLQKLDLQPTKSETFADSSVVTGPVSAVAPETPPAPVRTLTNLLVTPLHEIQVANGNGWRTQGWRELHALAVDANRDPYYLILYSNVSKGYVVDLKRAQTYVTNFGRPVTFANDNTVFGSKDDQLGGPPSLLVRRYARYEITLASSQHYANPYTEVLLDADLTAPDGKRVRVPGYWDGGNTWRVRFAPMTVGNWAWKTHSNDADLNNQSGTFTCVNTEEGGHGFVRVSTASGRKEQFQYADGIPFFPAYIADPIHFFAGSDALTPTVISQAPTQNETEAAPPSFQEFTHRVDQAAQLGFNRFSGSYLLDGVQFPAQTQRNEGGKPFISYDLSRLNPGYFQWMDRRLAYVTDKGIVPDLGLMPLTKSLTSSTDEADLRRLWRYVLARYASYNLCWNLFDTSVSDTEDYEELITELAQLTQRLDPYQHPITLVAPALPDTAPVSPTKRLPTPAESAANSTYVVIPDPSTLSQESGPSVPDQGIRAPRIANATADWLDLFSISKLPDSSLPGIEKLDHPTIVTDQRAVNPTDSVRFRLWAVRMRGAFWNGAFTTDTHGETALGSPVVEWASACNRLFAKTRFWRLAPHPEMLGGPEENPFVRRRRRRAQAEAARAQTQPGGNILRPSGTAAESDDQQPLSLSAKEGNTVSAIPATGPIYVQADPAWEYVIYFQRGGSITLDLIEATGKVQLQWLNPRTGETVRHEEFIGGAYKTFLPPDTKDWVLYISRR